MAGTRARRRTIDRGRCVTFTNLGRKLFAFSITLPSPLPRAEIDDSLFSHKYLVLKIANIIEEYD